MPLDLKATFIKGAYKLGVLAPIETDYASYERAVEANDPNHVRMVKPGSAPDAPLFNGLREAFIKLGYKSGFIPPITTSYAEWEKAADRHDPNHVRMRSPKNDLQIK